MTSTVKVRSVRAAVEQDLARIGKRDADVAQSGLALAALALADALDEPANSATSKANCAGALMDLMARLQEQAPALPKADRIDELIARRQRRRAG